MTEDDSSARPFPALAEIFERIGTDVFWSSLAHLCSDVAPRCAPIIYVFVRKGTPRVLHPRTDIESRDEYIETYLRAAYSTDPYYTHFLDDTAPGFYSLREIAPDDFYQTDYFNEYYRLTNVADEVAFLIPLADQRAVHISMTRVWSEDAFTSDEIAMFRSLQPVLVSAIARHFELLPLLELEESGASTDSAADRLESAFTTFGESVLTPREHEISRMLLRGRSPRSIAEELALSIDTVRNQRKSIYGKLEVSSHSELFGRFLDEISISLGSPVAPTTSSD